MLFVKESRARIRNIKPTEYKNKNLWKLTTPGERTNIKGVLVVESSNTDLISNTGGSTNLKSKWGLDAWEKQTFFLSLRFIVQSFAKLNFRKCFWLLKTLPPPLKLMFQSPNIRLCWFHFKHYNSIFWIWIWNSSNLIRGFNYSPIRSQNLITEFHNPCQWKGNTKNVLQVGS